MYGVVAYDGVYCKVRGTGYEVRGLGYEVSKIEEGVEQHREEQKKEKGFFHLI